VIFDHKQHMGEYKLMTKFVINYCQNQLVSTYGLIEVLVPENAHIVDGVLSSPRRNTNEMTKIDLTKKGKNNIYMSKDFVNPSHH
jgi:hypothetical protein